MEISITDLVEGFQETLSLYKQGESVFDIKGGALFPNITSQAKWKYARYPNALHLHDGNHTYAFKTPNGESEDQEFSVERVEAGHEFGKDATKTGLAQVHRADPGSIYFTVQEGTKNPTYTFRHVGGEKWKGIPKKRKAKKVQTQSVDQPHFVAGVKSAMEKLGFNLNQNAGIATENIAKLLGNTITAPGRHPWLSPLVGLGLGGAWDTAQRSLYNTPDENKQESGALRAARWLGPAAALGLTGGLEHGMLVKNQPGQQPFQYKSFR